MCESARACVCVFSVVWLLVFLMFYLFVLFVVFNC